MQCVSLTDDELWDAIASNTDAVSDLLPLALLNAEMTSGLYKKPIEVLARKVHYEPLPPELRAVVIASWTLQNVLPSGY